jgi:transcriptional regulator with XRE-family HTH domain
MVDKAFAKVLKDLRTRKGLAQEAFGFEIGLHRTYISQLERGLKSPTLRTIYRITSYFGIPMSDFMLLVESELENRSSESEASQIT